MNKKYMCTKPQSCNCQNKCSMNDIYMFLGKYTFDLLSEVQLPCGHPTLDEILLKVLEKDK